RRGRGLDGRDGLDGLDQRFDRWGRDRGRTGMSVRIGVVTFPGTLDDHDALRAVRLAGATPVPLWHAHEGVADVEALILPGGFSYGDYLRCGAIARFAPLMGE